MHYYMCMNIQGVFMSKRTIIIKHGSEPDVFDIFNATFNWCTSKNNDDLSFVKMDNKTVEATINGESAFQMFTDILTEYIIRHLFLKELDEICNVTDGTIPMPIKDIAFFMCRNISNDFLRASGYLLNWSLHNFFENNNSLNVSIYEKLNLKSLQKDFAGILRQPSALNYLFDSLERAAYALENEKDKDFLITALLTKSCFETNPKYHLSKKVLHVWVAGGKIMFGDEEKVLSLKDIVRKEAYENGFKPNKDMTASKIVSMAIMLTNPETVVVYDSVKDVSFKKFVQENVAVFGEINFVQQSGNQPNWRT